MEKQKYINPTQEAGKAFFMKKTEGPVVMLNLLKFKDVADYTNLEAIQPEEQVSGKKAYDIYMKHTLPFLQKAGGEVLFYGNSDHYLIGPEDESWDYVLLVKHASAEKFLAFAQDEGYLKIAGHRKAALEDSRLLPITGSGVK